MHKNCKSLNAKRLRQTRFGIFSAYVYAQQKERSTHAQLILKGFVEFQIFRQIVKCEFVNKKPKITEKTKVKVCGFHRKNSEVSKMPNWYWEKKELRTTPSQEKGLDFDTETRYRREGVR